MNTTPNTQELAETFQLDEQHFKRQRPLAQRLKEYRKETGLSQALIARYVSYVAKRHLSQVVISEIETGKKKPLPWLQKALEYFLAHASEIRVNYYKDTSLPTRIKQERGSAVVQGKYGKELQQLRLSLNIKQKDMAKEAGVSPWLVSRYENNFPILPSNSKKIETWYHAHKHKTPTTSTGHLTPARPSHTSHEVPVAKKEEVKTLLHENPSKEHSPIYLSYINHMRNQIEREINEKNGLYALVGVLAILLTSLVILLLMDIL